MTTLQEHLPDVAGRARDMLERNGYDALIASSPENVYYLSGQPSMFMYTFRMSEAAFAVVFRDPNRPSLLLMSEFEASELPDDIPGFSILTYPQWIDLDDPYGLKRDRFRGERPDAPRPDAALAALAEALQAGGLAGGGRTVAAELSGMRARKTGFEIAQLRESCAISEAALREAAGLIAPGVTAAELAASFRIAVTRRRFGFSERFTTISVGPHFAPVTVYGPHRAAPGDIIKFDVGADVQGYGADIARTFALGEPADAAKRAYAALRPGHDRMLALAGPGVPMAEVFREGMEIIRRSGLPDYNRGHLGHSIGLALATEEAPFFSAAETAVLEPGMVVCIETPYYGYGVGAVMIEDMLLITENGNSRFNQLTRDLVIL